MTQLLEDLKAVRELLSVPGRWTQNAHARDAYGKDRKPLDGRAIRWCIDGACIKVAGADGLKKRYRDLETAMTAAVGGGYYSGWNDVPNRTHADVVALLDKAIAAEEGQS